MARIYIENLPAEYRRKLSAGELTRETVDSLARSVSKTYQLRRQGFKRAVIICAAIMVLMAVLMLFSPNAQHDSSKVMLYSLTFTGLMVFLILAASYFAAVTRLPRQFDRCLKKGYPELEILYGYEQLISGRLPDNNGTQTSFSMEIEDTFRLQGSGDIVAAGFAHGLIERGNSVCIMDKNDPAKKQVYAIVTAIETGNQQPAAQAADCRAALRIQRGAALGLTAGMYLYRK